MIWAGKQLIQDGYIFDADAFGPWICERIGDMQYLPGSSTAVARVKAGRIVGGALYQDSNGANVFAHIAGEGRWLDRKLLSMLFHYPFEILGVKRISGIVRSDNLEAQQFDEHLGFTLEAVLKDAHPECDLLLYCMHRKDCRWLTELPYVPA